MEAIRTCAKRKQACDNLGLLTVFCPLLPTKQDLCDRHACFIHAQGRTAARSVVSFPGLQQPTPGPPPAVQQQHHRKQGCLQTRMCINLGGRFGTTLSSVRHWSRNAGCDRMQLEDLLCDIFRSALPLASLLTETEDLARCTRLQDAPAKDGTKTSGNLVWALRAC